MKRKTGVRQEEGQAGPSPGLEPAGCAGPGGRGGNGRGRGTCGRRGYPGTASVDGVAAAPPAETGLAGPQAARLAEPALADGSGPGAAGPSGLGLHGGRAGWRCGARARDCRPRGAAAQRDQPRPPPARQPNPAGGAGPAARGGPQALQWRRSCARCPAAPPPPASERTHWSPTCSTASSGCGGPSVCGSRLVRQLPWATWGRARGGHRLAREGVRGTRLRKGKPELTSRARRGVSERRGVRAAGLNPWAGNTGPGGYTVERRVTLFRWS